MTTYEKSARNVFVLEALADIYWDMFVKSPSQETIDKYNEICNMLDSSIRLHKTLKGDLS